MNGFLLHLIFTIWSVSDHLIQKSYDTRADAILLLVLVTREVIFKILFVMFSVKRKPSHCQDFGNC